MNDEFIYRELAKEYFDMTEEYHTSEEFLSCVGIEKDEFYKRKEEIIDIMEQWVINEVYDTLFTELDKYNLERFIK